jgi:hypothetical protein
MAGSWDWRVIIPMHGDRSELPTSDGDEHSRARPEPRVNYGRVARHAFLGVLRLLVVPLALRYPRPHPVWVLPVGLWFCTRAVNPHTWQVGIVLIVSAILMAAALVPASSRPVPLRRRRLATAVVD